MSPTCENITRTGLPSTSRTLDGTRATAGLHSAACWTPQEQEMLACNGFEIAHCPSSNTRLASGVAPVRWVKFIFTLWVFGLMIWITLVFNFDEDVAATLETSICASTKQQNSHFDRRNIKWKSGLQEFEDIDVAGMTSIRVPLF